MVLGAFLGFENELKENEEKKITEQIIDELRTNDNDLTEESLRTEQLFVTKKEIKNNSIQ